MKKIGWQLGGFLLLLFLPIFINAFAWHNFYYLFFCFFFYFGVGWFIFRWIRKPLKELYHFLEDIRLDTPLRNRLITRRGDIFGQLAKGLEIMERANTSKLSTLRGRMEEIRALLTSMSEGVIATDITGRISLINPAAADLFELNPGYGVGEFPYKVFPNSELGEVFHQVYVKGYPVVQEITWPSAPKKVLNLHLAPIRDDVTDEIRGVVAVIGDITKLRELESMRKEFVANVSHELRTPLTSIKGFIETLLDGALEEKETAHKFLSIINQETERLNNLIADTLEISKLESGQTELRKGEVYLDKLVDDISMVVANRLCDKQLAFERNLQVTTGLGDEDLLREVILNLLDNAIKYTPAGGGIVVGSRAKNGGVEFYVRDTGIGIPAESLPRLFERFYRVDKGRSREMGGTGLGLSIVKHIVERHGGKVFVTSEPGKGSEFAFFLPGVLEAADGTAE